MNRLVLLLLFFTNQTILFDPGYVFGQGVEIKLIDDKSWLIFKHSRDACETWDVPDTPMRAYRGSNGDIVVFQTHWRNRRLTGPDFRSLKHPCEVVYVGARNDDPAAFDDFSWIAATWSTNGRDVYAIVHNEYHGDLRPATCPTQKFMDCWYNTLTLAISHDGGESFQLPLDHLIAAVPYRAAQTVGDHSGYFEPSNLVYWKGAWYVTANVVAPAPQRPGNCILRTTDITSPHDWRAWGGVSFSVSLTDPYKGVAAVGDHLCVPLDGATLPWPIRNLVFHQQSQMWIALMHGSMSADNNLSGFFYSTSPDLLHWSSPRSLLAADVGEETCPSGPTMAYPALIDDTSTSRNFDLVGDEVILTYTATTWAKCLPTYVRDVYARRVRIVTASHVEFKP